MDSFATLVEFVKANYPAYAYRLQPGYEVAIDGLIFRPYPTGDLLHLTESGELHVTLAEALDMLRADMSEEA